MIRSRPTGDQYDSLVRQMRSRHLIIVTLRFATALLAVGTGVALAPLLGPLF
jgi:hypothetical protein